MTQLTYNLQVKQNNNIILNTTKAKQKIYSLYDTKDQMNLAGTPFENKLLDHIGCDIETDEIPNLLFANTAQKFQIYSIIRYRITSNNPHEDYVTDSIEKTPTGILYRPILNMFLNSFESISVNGQTSSWKLKFIS